MMVLAAQPPIQRALSAIAFVIFCLTTVGCSTSGRITKESSAPVDFSSTNYTPVLRSYSGAALSRDTVESTLRSAFVTYGKAGEDAPREDLICDCYISQTSYNWIVINKTVYQVRLDCETTVNGNLVEIESIGVRTVVFGPFTMLGFVGAALIAPPVGPIILAGGLTMDLAIGIFGNQPIAYHMAINESVEAIAKSTEVETERKRGMRRR